MKDSDIEFYLSLSHEDLVQHCGALENQKDREYHLRVKAQNERERWEGKFRVVRQENNQLRKQVRSLDAALKGEKSKRVQDWERVTRPLEYRIKELERLNNEDAAVIFQGNEMSVDDMAQCHLIVLAQQQGRAKRLNTPMP